ncbi:small RNA 2'-O-methyltransferase-like [Glandiceps talaboti]
MAETTKTAAKSHHENEDTMGGPKFRPPLYKQRYDAVITLARKCQPKKVLDMGCSECKLIRLLKNEPYIEELTGVDVDRSVLVHREHIITPLTTDYLFPRDNPLTVRLLQGSVADYDTRLADYDLVACVELIEHLDPPVLQALPRVIFHQIHPKVVVITTPNADFNELFPDFKGFRHWDHRFEWTRQEFQDWGNSIAKEHNYTVTYSGVGSGPEGSEHLGYCSQIAIFTRNELVETVRKDSDCGIQYKVVVEAVHPYKEKVPPEEKLLQEVQYYIRFLSRNQDRNSSDEEYTESDKNCNRTTIPLESLLKFRKVGQLCSNVDKLREILRNVDDVQLTEDEKSIVLDMEWSEDSSGEDYEDIEGFDDDEDHQSEGMTDNHIEEEIWE